MFFFLKIVIDADLMCSIYHTFNIKLYRVFVLKCNLTNLGEFKMQNEIDPATTKRELYAIS